MAAPVVFMITSVMSDERPTPGVDWATSIVTEKAMAAPRTERNRARGNTQAIASTERNEHRGVADEVLDVDGGGLSEFDAAAEVPERLEVDREGIAGHDVAGPQGEDQDHQDDRRDGKDPHDRHGRLGPRSGSVAPGDGDGPEQDERGGRDQRQRDGAKQPAEDQ